mgnify:CR=1 FL=1
MYYDFHDLLALLIVTAGTALQAWLGIGFGLVAAPLLYLLAPSWIPGPILILGFVLSLLTVLKAKHNLCWSRVSLAIAARLPGAWLGALILTSIPQYQLSLLFGGCILLAVWVSGRKEGAPITRRRLIMGGFFSGLTGTATSVGGPPIAMVYQNEERITARNELAGFFLLGTLLSIAMLALQGAIGMQDTLHSLRMLPGVILGFFIAGYIDQFTIGFKVRPVLLAIAAGSALIIIIKGLQGWLQ